MNFPTDLLGVPWVKGGRDPRPHVGGCDCLGIVLAGLQRMGIRVRDPWDAVLALSRGEQSRDVAAEVPFGEWREIQKDDASPGDLLVTNGGQHLSLIVAPGLVLGSCETVGSHLSQLREFMPLVESVWRRR